MPAVLRVVAIGLAEDIEAPFAQFGRFCGQ
jgi:hypothetical protein